MTRLVFTEFLGGLVYEVDDLDEDTLGQVGGRTLAGPSGPAIHSDGDLLVAEFEAHDVALAEPGGGWQRFGTQGCRRRRVRPAGRGRLSR